MQSGSVIGDWLHRRKITDEVQARFNIHGDNGRIVIPIHDANGAFLFNKYRRSPLQDTGPKYTYDRGGKLALFGMREALEAKELLVTEGEMDCLVAWSHNIAAVSSTGGALSISPEWARFFANKDVTVCFDNDAAGGEGMAKFIGLVPHAKVLLLPDMPNVKDISDYVMHGGDLHVLLRTGRHFQDIGDVMADRAERLAMFKSVHFHDAYIKRKAERPLSKRSQRGNEDDIERAKDYPIDRLMKFDMNRNTKCLWHSERSASLHWYANDNHVYCFGCGKHADAIDVYRKLNGVGFKEAVKALQ